MARTDVVEEPQPKYEALKQAVEDLMSSEEYGAPVGAVSGWVLVVHEQDLGNRREATTVVPAPWQSLALTKGILGMGHEEAHMSYATWEWGDDGDDDE